MKNVATGFELKDSIFKGSMTYETTHACSTCASSSIGAHKSSRIDQQHPFLGEKFCRIQTPLSLFKSMQPKVMKLSDRKAVSPVLHMHARQRGKTYRYPTLSRLGAWRTILHNSSTHLVKDWTYYRWPVFGQRNLANCTDRTMSESWDVLYLWPVIGPLHTGRREKAMERLPGEG